MLMYTVTWLSHDLNSQYPLHHSTDCTLETYHLVSRKIWSSISLMRRCKSRDWPLHLDTQCWQFKSTWTRTLPLWKWVLKFLFLYIKSVFEQTSVFDVSIYCVCSGGCVGVSGGWVVGVLPWKQTVCLSICAPSTSIYVIWFCCFYF